MDLQKLARVLFFISFIALVSCRASDPYGILEVEKNGTQTERLINCSQNEECPEYAQALFWVAVETLSNAGMEEREVEAIEYGITEDMNREEILQQLDNYLIEIDPPQYDLEDPEFKKGLSQMRKAYNAGSAYASNELGVLFLEHTKLKNLDLAKKYFTEALKSDDPNAAYNLARIARIQKPNQTETILSYLKQAAKSQHPDTKIMYMLGLKAFGTEAEKRTAARYLKQKNAETLRLKSSFQDNFNVKPEY